MKRTVLSIVVVFALVLGFLGGRTLLKTRVSSPPFNSYLTLAYQATTVTVTAYVVSTTPLSTVKLQWNELPGYPPTFTKTVHNIRKKQFSESVAIALPAGLRHNPSALHNHGTLSVVLTVLKNGKPEWSQKETFPKP